MLCHWIFFVCLYVSFFYVICRINNAIFQTFTYSFVDTPIYISVESGCNKWIEMDQVITTNLTLTLSVGWNVSCNNDGSVTQTATFLLQFSSKSTDCVRKRKNVECKINLRYLPAILIHLPNCSSLL